MRLTAEYEFDCPCGRRIVTPYTITRCLNCDRIVDVTGWRANPPAAVKKNATKPEGPQELQR